MSQKITCVCGANLWQAEILQSDVGGHHSFLKLHCSKCGRGATIAREVKFGEQPSISDVGFAITPEPQGTTA